MKIVIVGLGKMGYQIAKKLQDAGTDVLGVVSRSEKIPQLTEQGLRATASRDETIDFFAGQQPIIWLMIPADGVDKELDEWLKIVPERSIIIDGGNSDFRDTMKRATRAGDTSVDFLDVGTSGGIHGLKNGFSMMIGGREEAFKVVEPMLNALAKPSGAYQYFGLSGSGHYVKMIHNAIEYGMMQSLAEGYRMLHEGAYAGTINLSEAGEVWQHGSVVNSWLNGLAREAVAENPTLEGIDGFVAESGEARWTLESAKELGISLPAIQAAFDVRTQSQKGEVNFATKLLAAMRNKFGGHSINKA